MFPRRSNVAFPLRHTAGGRPEREAMSETVVPWNRIARRYLIIALSGSLGIVAGTYFLHVTGLDLEIKPDFLVERAGAVVSRVQDVAQDLFRTNRVLNIKTAPRVPSASPAPVAPRSRASSAPPSHSSAPSPGKWAVVQTAETPTYNREGKFLRMLPAGTLVDVVAIRQTREGEMAVCVVYHHGVSVPDVVMRTRDLDIRPGSVCEANPREKNLRVLRAQTLGQIEARKKELVKAAIQKNPYYAEYQRAYEEYRAFCRRAEALTRRRDEATGPDRMAYADQLRAMKGEDSRLKQAFLTAKQRYDDWKKQHASAAPSGGESDPQLAALNRKLAEIENELHTRN